MREKLISKADIKSLHPVFRKSYGDRLAEFVIRLAGLYKANDAYDSSKYMTGPDVENRMIDFLGITRKAHQQEVIDQFEGKPFITVSNHPYGHIDGIILIGTMAEKRPDFKIMVNWMLGRIDTMADHFIGVNPFQAGTVDRSSLGGVKECIQHLKEGRSLGFFPAGAISKNRITRIEDRDWQTSVLKLIKKAGVPIVPVYISGNNSRFFNFLDLIDWRLRTLRLCHELTNKKGKTIHLVFGTPILPEEQKNYTDITAFGKFLKERTYELKESEWLQ
ncbi:MAG: lysophospholipid acyltransferase family protein [Dysgonamonadaceae bacterium]|nr:lysophospholipid acyltransferase family protein [Dysgonamonadaceae bacterium]